MKKRFLFTTCLLVASVCGCSNNTISKEANSEIDANHSTLSNDSVSSEQYNLQNNTVDALYFDSSENIYEHGIIYGNGDNPKMYMDFNSMESTVLCARPNCTHTTSECIAKQIGKTPIIYNDYIYFFDVKDGVKEESDGRTFYIDSKLKRVSLATSEIDVISEFTDCEPREYDGGVIFDGTLYFCGDDMNPTADDYGGISYANGGGTHYLCSIDLDSGEYTNYGSIYDEDKNYESANHTSTAHITGYYNSKIYIQYSFMKEYNENTEIDTRDKFTFLNFEFDPKTKTLILSELPTASFMNNNTYVCSNYPDNSTTVFWGDKKYIVNGADAKFIGKFFNGKLFIYDHWYDVTSGTLHSLGDDKKFVTMYNDCYIISNQAGTKYEKLTENELLSLDKG